jgi:hypothetical protein
MTGSFSTCKNGQNIQKQRVKISKKFHLFDKYTVPSVIDNVFVKQTNRQRQVR